MNLFRSEEHARRWSGYSDEMEAAMMPIDSWAEIFSNPFFSERGRPDYLSWMQSEAGAEAFVALRSGLPQPNAN